MCTRVSLKELQGFSSVHTFNMLVLKFSWITSLLFLCQHGAEAERVVACEGASTDLHCGRGFIMVHDASYGRTDRDTCASGRPANQLSNTQCHAGASLSIMSDRCDGMRSCTVPAVNSIFSDPCGGTYKYLDVSYDCIPAQRSVTCEGERSLINCAPGVISILHANYGRRDLETCPHPLASTSDCYSPQTSSLSSRCNGRRVCKLDTSVFSDPCVGVHKYLEVLYSCECTHGCHDHNA